MNKIRTQLTQNLQWGWKLFALVLMVLLVTACAGSGQTTPSEIPADTPRAPPTQEVVATPAPSDKPEPTDIPESTETPSPTDTPTPTETPAPTSTPTPDLEATAAAEATQKADTLLADIHTELENIGYSTESGNLGWIQEDPVEILVDTYEGFLYDPFAEGLEATDFVLKTDITWESSGGFAGCGLIFRSESNFEQGEQYELEVIRLSGLPGWDIVYNKYGEFQKNVTGILTAGAINQDQGSTNTYILIAEEGKFTLYVNEQRIGSYYDYANSRLEGQFAFTGWQESGQTTCSYDNTWVWLLE
jgi:hypothetical protein